MLFYVNTPSFLLFFPFTVFCLGLGWFIQLFHFHMHPFSHPFYFFSFLIPYIYIDSSNYLIFCFSLCLSLLVSSVPVEHGHKSGRLLLVSTNVDKSSQRLNSYRLLLQSKQNTFQSLLQFCKRCVHFLFLCTT